MAKSRLQVLRVTTNKVVSLIPLGNIAYIEYNGAKESGSIVHLYNGDRKQITCDDDINDLATAMEVVNSSALDPEDNFTNLAYK